MAKINFTNKAVDDLTDIWNYTFEKWSENHADVYYLALIKNCNEFAVNPQLGKNYDRIASNLYGFKAGRHIIFYRILGPDLVEITRILHEQMDLEHRILEQ